MTTVRAVPATGLCALAVAVLVAACGATKVSPPAGAVPANPPGTERPPAPDAGLALPDAADATVSAPGATCAAETHKAESVPVDLVFVIDQSPSMAFKIGDRTKWSLAQDALRTFLGDPRSAGLGVGLQFFPIRATAVPCASDTDCGFLLACANAKCSRYPLPQFPSCAPGDYEKLTVDVAPLPAARAGLLAALEREPNLTWGLSSPLGPAADGVVRAVRARLGGSGGRKTALVLVTDGVPSGCFYGWTSVNQIATGLEAEVRKGVQTFVIGLYSDSADEDAGGPAALARYATAGGTGAPFTVKPPGDVTRAFLDALDKVRAASVPCEYVIPRDKAAGLDFAKVNLHAKLPSGESDVPYVTRADRCSAQTGGWYYDVDPASATPGRVPTRVMVCPATCAVLKGAAEVTLTFGCKTRTID